MGYDMSMVGEIAGLRDHLDTLRRLINEAVEKRNALPKEEQGTYDPVLDKDRDWDQAFSNASDRYKAAHKEVLDLMEEESRTDRTYFRLNIWGMSRYRDVMQATGMGYWSDEFPSWPTAEQFDLTQEQGWLDLDDPDDRAQVDDDTARRIQALHDASDAVRRAHPGEFLGIPLEKFTSNDGWHVLPHECKGALIKLGEFLAPAYGEGVSSEDALTAFRKADQTERAIMANRACTLEVVGTIPVPPWKKAMGIEDTDVADILAEDYFQQWLRFLEDGITYGGFKVY